MIRWLQVLLAGSLLLVAGCVDPRDGEQPKPIPNTTWRIGQHDPAEGSELRIEIFNNRRRCRSVFSDPDTRDEEVFATNDERIDACTPFADRYSGQVHLAFRLTDPDNVNRGYQLPLEANDIEVRHNRSPLDNERVEVTLHEPSTVGQLFIIVVDHSGSMNEVVAGKTRMDHVRAALRANADTFLSGNSAVAMFQFTQDVRGFDGTSWAQVKPIRSKKKFYAELESMGRTGGFTHLYKAVRTSVGNLIDADTYVSRFLAENDMLPTLVVLTDGFNNEASSDRCATNAERLQLALREIRRSRKKPLSQRPTLYTVGFGKPFRKSEIPEDQTSVSARELCGQYADRRIDGALERRGIDNVSLEWMAQIGGGVGFIESNHRKLKNVFESTRPRRYTWYQVRSELDPGWLRAAFTLQLVLKRYARASSSITLYPSAWMDAPSARVPAVSGSDDEPPRWVEPSPMRRASAFLIPMVSFFVLLTFLGPALFNGRRAVTRTARGRSSGKG